MAVRSIFACPAAPRFALAALLLILLATGCGKRKPEMGQVEGTVRVKGQPHAGLFVRFLPDPEKGNNLPINASGKTDAQGKYTLQHEYDGAQGSGAPVGWHRVLIEDNSRGPTPQGQTPPPPLIPVDYNNPATTPLRFEVKPGSQTIDLDVAK
jgi:hypothetical protein